MALIMTIAVVITGSIVAIASLAIVISLWFAARHEILRFRIIYSLLAVIILLVGLFFTYPKFHEYVSQKSSGRIPVWENTLKDIRDGALIDSNQDFSMTGVGLGRFAFVFPGKHSSNFMQAHNDVLEFVYNCGILGLFLLFMALAWMLKYSIMNPIYSTILLSFTAIFLCSLGGFPFQLGAHQFYSSVLLGLLHNDSIKKAVI